MYLNTIKPAKGSTKVAKRVGRGIGSGLGKTCGRGHKGQKSRTGGTIMPGFEGGQMPLQKRLPKTGFSSRVSKLTDEVRLNELNRFDGVVDIFELKKANIITKNIERVKVIASGEITKAITVKGLMLTKGAQAAIEAAGGKVE
ncbi:MAG: 50S ribosomal protein L15 [Gammaproteobacteria bacterium]|nr:50S ribosomal protein L15 [Gammaproteobacteria bacterium]